MVQMIDYLDGGGAERFVIALAERLDPRRFDVAVVATRESRPELAGGVVDAGVPLLLLGRTGRFRVHEWRPLWRLLRGERVDVVHAHLHGSNVWASVLGRMAGVPVVIATEHTWSFSGKPLRRALDRWVVAPLVSSFVAVSERDRRQLIEVVGVPAGKTRMIRTGLVPHGDGGTGTASGAALRAELSIPADVPVIATAAWLRAQKALHVLIEAFALLVGGESPDAHLLIAGEGDERERLERLASDLGLSGRVHLPGVRRDVPALLDAADVVAMSSEFEGSPLFLLEAMAAGKPIVSTAVGGIPDMVEDGESALLVPSGDAPALATSLSRVLGDPALAERLGAAAEAHVLRDFSFDAIAAEWASLYEELYEAHLRREREGLGALAPPAYRDRDRQ